MVRGARGKRQVGADGAVRVHGKSANGEGSVYEDRSNGCWIATYRDPATHKLRKVRGRTQAEAKARRAARIDQLALKPSGVATSATTVLEMAEWWLENDRKVRTRQTSYGAYAARVTRARLGRLADLPVAAVTVDDVARWQRSLLEGPHALRPKTVADSLQSLRQVLNLAVDHGIVPWNVATRVRPPKVEKPLGRSLTLDERRRLIDVAKENPVYGDVVVALFALGLRISEVLGLAWSDVDLTTREYVVRRAVVEPKGAGREFSKPKTRGALGDHIMTTGVAQALFARRARQEVDRLRAGTAWLASRDEDGRPIDLIFTDELGRVLRRQAVDRYIRQCALRAGINAKGLGTHVGRRTVMTELHRAGVSVHDLQQFIGHRSATTTKGYITDLGDRPRRVAEIADSLFNDD